MKMKGFCLYVWSWQLAAGSWSSAGPPFVIRRILGMEAPRAGFHSQPHTSVAKCQWPALYFIIIGREQMFATCGPFWVAEGLMLYYKVHWRGQKPLRCLNYQGMGSSFLCWHGVSDGEAGASALLILVQITAVVVFAVWPCLSVVSKACL